MVHPTTNYLPKPKASSSRPDITKDEPFSEHQIMPLDELKTEGEDRLRPSIHKPEPGLAAGQEHTQPIPSAKFTAGPSVDASESKERRDRSTDSESSTDTSEEERRKKLRGKELLAAGLATLAVNHAAHRIYSSYRPESEHRKLVADGGISPEEEMTPKGETAPEETRKRMVEKILRDAANVGVTAIDIESAFSEWKQINEQRISVKELEQRRWKKKMARERREEGDALNPYVYPVAAAKPYQTTYADANWATTQILATNLI